MRTIIAGPETVKHHKTVNETTPHPQVADTKSGLDSQIACRLLILALFLYGISFLTLEPLPTNKKILDKKTLTLTQPPVSPPSTILTLEAYTRRVAQNLGVDEALVLAVLVQESDPIDSLRTGKGDSRGPLQIKPITLEHIGLSPDERSLPALIHGGILYLKAMLIRFRSLPIALAAYNMGPERLRQRDYHPYASTQHYISCILARAEEIHAGTFPPTPVLQHRLPVNSSLSK